MKDQPKVVQDRTDAEEYAQLDSGETPAWAPVPVFLTEPAPVEEQPARSFVAGQLQLQPGPGGTVVPQVIAKHIARLTVHVRNIGTANLYLGQDQPIATASSGYLLPPGGAIEIDTTHDLWIGSDGLKASDGTPGGVPRAAFLSTFRDGS